MLGRAGIEKAPLTQYVRWAGTKKDLFTENLNQGLYKKVPLTQYLRWGLHFKGYLCHKTIFCCKVAFDV